MKGQHTKTHGTKIDICRSNDIYEFSSLFVGLKGLRFSLVNAKKRGSSLRKRKNQKSTIHYEILNHLSSALHCTFLRWSFFLFLSLFVSFSLRSFAKVSNSLGVSARLYRDCFVNMKSTFFRFVSFGVYNSNENDLFAIFIAQHWDLAIFIEMN